MKTGVKHFDHSQYNKFSLGKLLKRRVPSTRINAYFMVPALILTQTQYNFLETRVKFLHQLLKNSTPSSREQLYYLLASFFTVFLIGWNFARLHISKKFRAHTSSLVHKFEELKGFVRQLSFLKNLF